MSSDCVEWKAGKTAGGYGWWRGKYAHRIAFEAFVGPIPEGQCVCHHCDNPSCINPMHLFLGTKADNNRDMFAKGRGRPGMVAGERHGRSKLSYKDVAEIRARRHSGETLVAIARDFGVTHQAIHGVVTGRTWR